jgi:hypothetical protein
MPSCERKETDCVLVQFQPGISCLQSPMWHCSTMGLWTCWQHSKRIWESPRMRKRGDQENQGKVSDCPRCYWRGSPRISSTGLFFFFDKEKLHLPIAPKHSCSEGSTSHPPSEVMAVSHDRASKDICPPFHRKCIEGRSLIKKQPSQWGVEQKFSWLPAGSSSCSPCIQTQAGELFFWPSSHRGKKFKVTYIKNNFFSLKRNKQRIFWSESF